MSTVLRDFQRSKVYFAEKVLRSQYHSLLALPAVQQYCTQLAVKYSLPPIVVKDGRARRRPCYDGLNLAGQAVIKLPRFSRNIPIILHEVAHVAVGKFYSHRAHSSHGAEYCEIFLRLVLSEMGERSFDALRQRFDECGVKYNEVKAPFGATLSSAPSAT